LKTVFLCLLTAGGLAAQQTLTLAEAEEYAVANNPRLSSARLTAQAVDKTVAEAKAARYPTLSVNVTGTGAETGTTVSAGALTTSSLSNRAASGLALSQLITDFGRTKSLTETARLRAAAQSSNAEEVRTLVRLEVRRAYYQSLAARAVLKVAQAVLEQRRITLRQITALGASLLKSTLDVRFAEVAVSEAELALYQAENNLHENNARLAAAMGYDKEQSFTLVEDPLPGPLDASPDPEIDQALKTRPDLESLGLSRDAAHEFAVAEARLRRPTISLQGASGVVPAHDHTIKDNYAAAGVNFNLPILNGGLYKARQAEAELRAQAAEKDVRDLALRISRDVQVAWLQANNAYRSLDVMARLVAQANEALRLAQARYDIGLSSIVELTQAQFSQTSAQIGAANAKFDYLTRRAELDYETGALR
jgi:outer membrane protein